MTYTIGIDVGTSSTKAVLVDEKGYVVSRHSVKNTLLNPKPGFYEVDALGSWWNGLLSILDAFRPYVVQVKALCISSVCGSFVPVDKDFNPVYNAILYGIDTRSVEEIKEMNQTLYPLYVQDVLAGPFSTQSVLPKILWLKRNEREVYDRTAFFVESNNFLTARLTGVAAWDISTAFAAKLAERGTASIPSLVCHEFGLDEKKLPPLKWPCDKLGTITREASLLTGLPETAVVYTGACDINAEAMSMLSVFPGDNVLVLGSTISMLHMMDHYVPLQGFVTGYSVLQGTYRFGAATSSGGLFLKTIDEFFGFTGKPEGEKHLPTGLLMLPYITGARTPFNNPFASGAIHGIKSTTKREDFYWAAREAVGYEVYLLIEKMEAAGETIGTLHVSGGIANDEDTMRILADITGRTLVVHNGTDASYGDALIAIHGEMDWAAIKQLEGFVAMENSTKVYQPSEKAEQYATERAEFVTLCNNLVANATK